MVVMPNIGSDELLARYGGSNAHPINNTETTMSDDKPSDRAIAQAYRWALSEVDRLVAAGASWGALHPGLVLIEHKAKEIDAQQPNGESAEPVEYQVRPSGFGEESWRSVSKREFEDRRDTPTGFPPDRWDRRALYAHPLARSDEPMSKSRAHRLAVQRGDEPSVWDWKQAFLEWHKSLDYSVKLAAWRSIEQRARELAREGK